MIAYAYIKDGWLEVYDKDERELWHQRVEDDAQILGNTATTVTLKRNGWIEVYDETGNEISHRRI